MKLVSIILLFVGISIVVYLRNIEICGPDPGFALDYKCISRISLLENGILIGTLITALCTGILVSSGSKGTQWYLKLGLSVLIGGILGFILKYLFKFVTA